MIKDLTCSNLSDKEYQDLKTVFSGAFDTEHPDDNIKNYLSQIDHVLLMYENQQPTAFLFYQVRKVPGCNILQLSLSGKTSKTKGVQNRLGFYLYFTYIFKLSALFKLNAFVTVSNNPRSYYNMHAISDCCYPNVLNSSQNNEAFKHYDLYQYIAHELAMDDVNEQGVILNRMQKLGFKIKQEESNRTLLDSKGLKFLDYIDNDVSHGVLVMAFIRPITDVPRYFLRRAERLCRKSWQWSVNLGSVKSNRTLTTD